MSSTQNSGRKSNQASIGDYIVEERIGSGSFAIVYRGYHRISRLPVAIKAINKSKLNVKLLENLESEISIMRKIEHPNIVKLYDIKKTQKHIYLMMEYCGGGDLQQYIKKRQTLPEQVAKHFLHELANGLYLLWSLHLIHRDLKPQNLLLVNNSETSQLKIADFGFARHLETSSLAETLCGSPLYMAPEILRFQKYDAKADLWSVGTILYEMVVGKPPFTGMNQVQLLHNIERQQYIFPNTISVSPSLITLLDGLLRRDPVTRMSFEEFFTSDFVQIDIFNEKSNSVAMLTADESARATSGINSGDQFGAGGSSGLSSGSATPKKVMHRNSLHPSQHSRMSYQTATNTDANSSGSSSQASNMVMNHHTISKPMNIQNPSSVHSVSNLHKDYDQNSIKQHPMSLPAYTASNSISDHNLNSITQGPLTPTSITSVSTSATSYHRSSFMNRRRSSTNSHFNLNYRHNHHYSPTTSPDLLPSPSPRTNPFKSDSPPNPLMLLHAPASAPTTLAHTRGLSVGQLVTHQNYKPLSHSTSLKFVPNTYKTLKSCKSDNASLDQSGEYVIIDDDVLSNGLDCTTSRPASFDLLDSSKLTSRTTAPRQTAFTSTTTRTISPTPSTLKQVHTKHYHHSIGWLHRLHSIAFVADQLVQFSGLANAFIGPSASITSISSSVSSSVSSSMALNWSNSLYDDNLNDVQKKKKKYCLLEALILYLKCLSGLHEYVEYNGTLGSSSNSKPVNAIQALELQGMEDSFTSSADKSQDELSELCEMRELFLQYLDRAEFCKRFLHPEMMTHLKSLHEILYCHAIRLGKEAAMQEVLGQHSSAMELYTKASHLVESIILAETNHSDVSLKMDDQQYLQFYLQAFQERIQYVKTMS